MKVRAHESFCFRKGWLHKGAKNINANSRLFTSKDINPCDILGIGTNMVKSLRYWMNATSIMEEVQDGIQRVQRLTDFGQIIYDNDKYYEEDGTKWAIHYMLAKNSEWATAWYWFFNVYKMNTIDKALFIREFGDYIATEYEVEYSEKVLGDEFDCLVRTYCAKDKDYNPEDLNYCPLTELQLLENVDGKNYKKRIPDKDSIPILVLFGVICDQFEQNEILIADLMDNPLGISKIFNLDRTTCFYCLDALQKMGYIEISRTAGLDVIRIMHRLSFNEALLAYYSKINGVN